MKHISKTHHKIEKSLDMTRTKMLYLIYRLSYIATNLYLYMYFSYIYCYLSLQDQ